MNALDALVEDPRDAICLDENGAVADAQTEADSHPEAGTRPNIGRCENDEGHAVATKNARQQHVAQFAARCLYHGRFVISK